MAEIKVKQTLNDTLKEYQQEIFKNINCVKVGKIVSFDPEKKVANVSINFFSYDEKPEFIYKNEMEYEDPIICELPVIGNCFHQPIIEGMSVLCLFNDDNIDNWFYNENTTDKINDRKHDVSDGFILCGLDNLINNSFERPSWWNPIPNLPKVCDCPIPHWGYDNDHAQLRYGAGDVSVGYDGVTICGRDYMDVKIFAEGSSVGIYPMGNFEVDNSKGRFIAHGWGNQWYMFENTQGKFSMFNGFYTKPNKDTSIPGIPDTFILSDMYRLLKQAKKTMADILAALELHIAGQDTASAAAIAAAHLDIIELIARIDFLFVPGDGIDLDEIEGL